MDQHSSSAIPGAPASTERVPAAPANTEQAPAAPAITASDRVPWLAWVIAAVFVAVELAVSGRYGFMQDELYFIVAGHHLAFGYVDQPPLAPLLTRLTDVFGVNPTAVRIFPALAGGVVVVAAAKLAALMGGGRLGRVLAALATACAPVTLGAAHYGNTTAPDLLAWAIVLVCVAMALLRDRPRWWLGAGAAAGLGLENENLIVLLVGGLLLGVLVSRQRDVLRTPWPWLGGVIALAIWAPNLIWQATHGWPQLAMASALHQQNTSAGDYLGGLPGQLIYPGILVIPVLIAGFVMLWRTPELRFMAVAVTIIVLYVLVWVPGKVYYSDGMVPAVLAAGSVSAERWVARGRRPRLRRGLLVAAPVVGMLVLLPITLPLVPVNDLHKIHALGSGSSVLDTVGWPQLTATVAAQDAALGRAGIPPTSIFTGYYGEAAALQVLGTHDHLPPVLSGHNAYWMWGPGHASDRTVLVVDALGQLRPYFAQCRLLTTFNPPDQVNNDWTNLQIGVCTGPSAGWPALWPHLRHYD
jgi:4-amino-4-deoxy-L-arabinose transferase-like glycosyltransferase